MRFLFLLIILHTPLRAQADSVTDLELRGIPLVSTSSYDPTETPGRGLKKFFNGIALAIGGPSQDLKKTVLEKLDQEALRKYFPDASERNSIAQRIANKMHSDFLSYGYTNANTLAAQRYSTNELISIIVKRVLKVEGVDDSFRANAWAVKILEPFNRCISLARAYTEGSKCSEPLEKGLVMNMGLAMTYETIRQQFGREFAKPQVDKYWRCVQPGAQGYDNRAANCALQSVRNTVKDSARTQIEAAARKQVPGSATKIVAKVMPDFNRCVDKAKDKNGFTKCGDALVVAAGAEVASEAIRGDKRLRTYFPNQADIDRLADSGRDAFIRCMEENDRSNRRSKSGTLDTDICGLYTQQETTKMVAFEFFRSTLEKNMKDPKARAQLLRDVSSDFEACWDSRQPETKNAPCMRKAALRLAYAAAQDRIDRELPKDIRDSNPKLRDKLLADFDLCLNKNLPANLLASNNAEAVANSCANGLMRSAAVTVAEQKVRAALADVAGDFQDKTEMDNLIDIFVRKDFVKCLGDNPDEATLQRCGLSLQKNVAMQVANALLPFKINDFFSAMGGPEAYGITEKDRDALTKAVLDGHKQCLKKEVKSFDSAESTNQVNDCFKTTIRDLALRIGPLEFDRAAKENKIDTTAQSFIDLHKQFEVDLGQCLDEKRDRKFSVDDYLKGIDTCQGKLTKFFTVRVAKLELNRVAGQAINQVSSGSRDEMLDSLMGTLESCLEKANDAKARDACMADLRRESTGVIVSYGVRQRVLKELELTDVPGEIKEMEATFKSCLKAKKDPDVCGKAHVVASTSWLGKQVMNKKLKAELKGDYDKLGPEIKKLEQDFDRCLQSADATLEQKLLQQLETCGSQLTDATLDFLFANAKPEAPAAAVAAIATIPASLGKDALADNLSRTLLCLNGNLATENQESLAQVDPGSVEAEMLKLMGSYIDYDLKKAQGQYEEVLKQASEDLKAAGPEEARKKLLDLLVKNGMADQLVKAVLLSELSRGIQALPAERRPPAALEKVLLDKATLERALTPEVMAKLRPMMAEGVLEPVVVGGKTLKSSTVLRSLHALKSAASEEILRSPELATWKSDNAAWDNLKSALEAASK